MRLEVLTKFPVGPEWAAGWDALAARCGSDDVFVTYDWARAAAEFDRQARLLIVCGYVCEPGSQTEGLVGLAPLALRRCRVAGRRRTVLELLTGPWADYNELIAEPAWRDEFIRRVAELAAQMLRQHDCSHLCLNNLPEDSPTLKLFADAACRLGLQVTQRQRDTGPALVFEGTDGAVLDELLEKKGIVRKRKALAKKGRLEFRIVREPDEVRDCLSRLWQLHTARYLLNGQPGIYDPASEASLCRLLERLAERMTATERILLPALFLDGEPIALALGFEHRGALTLYALTFDVGVMGTSPGEMLVLEIARHCRRAGMRRLDFGAGAEAYKARFTNTQRRTFELIAHHGSPALAARSALLKIKDRARQHPVGFALLRRVRGLCQLYRLEARRTTPVRAIISLLSEQCRELLPSVSSQLGRKKVLPRAAGVTELRARDLAGVVLKYRRELPSWEFRKAYDLLRQGERCYLVMQRNRLIRIIGQRPLAEGESVGSLTSAPEPQTVPQQPDQCSETPQPDELTRQA
jgi:CelD/BcsL family acetyltransferase involved in cellulose biosynthesis